MSTWSVIIPTLDEAPRIGACLASVRRALPQAEILVVDAGSQDGTPALARAMGARVLRSAPGRGVQGRLGASEAGGRYLLFLHADALLLPEVGPALEDFARQGGRLGKLRLTYPTRRWRYRLLNWMAHRDHYLANTGDQGMLLERGLYDEVGGMPAWPLFEDVALFQRAGRRARLRCLKARVLASPRRLEANGLLLQLGLDAWLMLRYALGADPHKLAQVYRRTRRHRGVRLERQDALYLASTDESRERPHDATQTHGSPLAGDAAVLRAGLPARQ